jgi:citrate lyase gamma subunit
MLMSENLFVACAEIAHPLVMRTSDMAVKIWPSKTSNIAVQVRAVVSQQDQCVLENLRLLVLDAQVGIDMRKVRVVEVVEFPLVVVCEYDRV